MLVFEYKTKRTRAFQEILDVTFGIGEYVYNAFVLAKMFLCIVVGSCVRIVWVSTESSEVSFAKPSLVTDASISLRDHAQVEPPLTTHNWENLAVGCKLMSIPPLAFFFSICWPEPPDWLGDYEDAPRSICVRVNLWRLSVIRYHFLDLWRQLISDVSIFFGVLFPNLRAQFNGTDTLSETDNSLQKIRKQIMSSTFW